MTHNETEQVALPTGFEQISEQVQGMARDLEGIYRYHGPLGTYRLRLRLSAYATWHVGSCDVWSPLALQWNALCTLTEDESAGHALFLHDEHAGQTARLAALQQDRNRLLERALRILAP